MDKLYFSSKIMKSVLELTTNFLFPPFCLGCGNYLGWKADSKKLCQMCDLKLNTTCQDTIHIIPGNKSIEKLFVFGKYGEQPLTNLIHKAKYQNKAWALEPIAVRLRQFIKTFELPLIIDCVTCVPLHPKRLRERGFNQAELLARAVSAIARKPLYLDLLKRQKFTKAQMSIASHKDRFKNVKGAFAINESVDLKNKKVLIVDDVATTSATLQECARCIADLGGKAYGFVLAH